MPRQIAFLRAINVGGRTVKMEELREHFRALGFAGVATVIASGNVVFETDEPGGHALERRIEAHLADALGYEVATFVRTSAELTAVAREQPFAEEESLPPAVVYALFLRDRPTAALARRIAALDTENDVARVGRREVYWLRRERVPASDEFGARLGKVLGVETTSRNMNTVRRIVEKFC